MPPRDLLWGQQNEISVERRVANLFAKTAIGTRLVLLKTTPHLKGNWFSKEKYVAPAKWVTWARDVMRVERCDES